MTRYSDQTNERRNKQRFPMQRELRYKIMEHGWSTGAGTGMTSDVSSGGVAFTSDRSLPVDTIVEISMSWPVTLENACPLQLVARGRVVRNEGTSIACTIEKFEFRTQARAQGTVSMLATLTAARTQAAGAMA